MSFAEPLGPSARTSRVLAVDLATLTPGEYELRIRAETGGRESGESVRWIRIVRNR
jgi:hypothetical protein